MEYDLKIFTDNIDQLAITQIKKLMQQQAFKYSKVRIMPDVHAGKNCVIGFTGDLGDKVIPSIVGVDIGCGMFCANLGKIDIDYKKIDDFINDNIPSGGNVNEKKVIDFDLTKLICYEKLKYVDFLERSIGSLGGGNHFIEIDKDSDDNKYLVIHTGSRNLGAQVANYYQDLANKICHYKILEYQKEKEELIEAYKLAGRTKEISEALINLAKKYENIEATIPYEFTYLEGKYRDAYLHDMKICQDYAALNRYVIASKIANYMGWSIEDHFESVHNYISFEDNIVRKGAISAKEGERVIIPMNMRDGCLIGIGKGNPDWNYSAPHGAGRIMSRSKAKELVNLEDYKNSMKDIYTTSVNEGTLDESPFVYKKMEEILANIVPTVEVTNIVKPVYNYKASETLFLDTEENKESKTR